MTVRDLSLDRAGTVELLRILIARFIARFLAPPASDAAINRYLPQK